MLNFSCFMSLVLLFAMSLVAQEQTSPAEKMWQRCSSCHVTPDRAVPGDLVWAERIASTACIQPKPPKSSPERSILKSWLLAAERSRPRRVDHSAQAQQDEGSLTVRFIEGSVLLVPHNGGPSDPRSALRLVWSKAQGGARALPAGEWRIAGYRLQRRDKEGTEWQLWAAGGTGRVVSVVAGKEAQLEIDERVITAVSWSAKGQKLQVGVSVKGDSDLGATVVRGGERVPARYVLRNGVATAAAGDMEYG
ncbi:MAG: hypothetical protein EXS14_07350 [Planctomycetes bacterium]|nr:hypothetical protein [Planctomycetota bacterium]